MAALSAAMGSAAAAAGAAGRVGRQWGGSSVSSSSRGASNVVVVRRSRGVVSSSVRTGAVASAAAAGGQKKNKRGPGCVGAAAGENKFGIGLAGMGMGQPALGAFHAAALACGGVPGTSPASLRAPSRASVVARAAVSSRDENAPKPKFENVGVFNVSTEKLPGGDKLSNEGILGFVLAAFLAFWFGTTAIRTFAVMIGFVFTTAKYFAMGIALLLIGVAVS